MAQHTTQNKTHVFKEGKKNTCFDLMWSMGLPKKIALISPNFVFFYVTVLAVDVLCAI